jgi:H+/gluconate symporter-like permease
MGIPCVLSFVLYAQWLAKKYPSFISSVHEDDNERELKSVEKKLPSLTLSLLPIVVPILLILIKALISFFPLQDVAEGTVVYWLVQVFNFLGTPMIALCVSTLLAVYTLVPTLNKQQTSARLEEGLQSAGIILLVTGAGGALGFVVRESGAGTLLAGQIANLPFSPVMIPFFVASVVRLIQGSATVAMITSASITAPILSEIPDVHMLFAAQAAAIGAFLFSYFNDSLFWVVGKLMGISDVKVHITTWSVPTILSWAVGGVLIALLNLLFGSRGSLLDLLVPVIGLGIVFWIVKKK